MNTQPNTYIVEIEDNENPVNEVNQASIAPDNPTTTMISSTNRVSTLKLSIKQKLL